MSDKRKDIQKHFAWISMAKSKRKDKFDDIAERNKDLYAGKAPSSQGMVDSETINVNMTYANVESQKYATFIRNPKIYLSPEKSEFRIGDEVIDGPVSARITEFVVNNIYKNIDLEEQMAMIRDDNIMGGGFGVLFFGYGIESILDEHNNEHIKDENIFVKRLNPSMFLCDVECTDMEMFTDAKWVGREVLMSKADGESLFDLDKDKLNKIDLVGYSETVGVKDGDETNTRRLIDGVPEDYKESEDVKRLRFYQIWQAPSAKAKAKNKKAKGKVFWLLEGYNDYVKPVGEKEEKKSWPWNDMEGYPFIGLMFNKINDRQYGPSDISIYEEQLYEKNKIRTYGLEYLYKYMNPLIMIDSSVQDPDKLVDKINDAKRVGGVVVHDFGGGEEDIRKKVFMPTLGSLSSQAFNLENRIDDDRDQVSNRSELQRGQEAPRRKSATQSENELKAGSGKYQLRLYRFAKMYKRLTRKVIQLVREFYPEARIANIYGIKAIEGWPDNFNKNYIQDETDIKVDVSNMSEVNEAVRNQQSLKMLEMVSNAIVKPEFMKQLTREGRTLSISAAIDEVMKNMNIMNQDLVPSLTDEEEKLTMMRLINPQLEAQLLGVQQGQQAPGGGGGGSQVSPTAPSTSSVQTEANRPVGMP